CSTPLRSVPLRSAPFRSVRGSDTHGGHAALLGTAWPHMIASLWTYGTFDLSLPMSLRCFKLAVPSSGLKPGFAFPSVTWPDKYQQLPIRSATEAARAQRLLRVGSADADDAGCTVWTQGRGALGQRAGISARK